jgi:hypothetical protein
MDERLERRNGRLYPIGLAASLIGNSAMSAMSLVAGIRGEVARHLDDPGHDRVGRHAGQVHDAAAPPMTDKA